MPSLEHRLNLLQREPLPAVASILAASVAHAEPQERQAICAALLATGEPTALAALIGCLHRLGPQTTRMLRTAPIWLAPAVGLIRSQGRRQGLLNAIDLARQRADVALLGDLAQLLESPLNGVAPAAAGALLAVVVAHAGPDGRQGLDPEKARLIDNAVASAVSSFPEHRLRNVLLAAAVLAARPGPKLARILSDPDHPAMFPMRSVVARTDDPLVRTNLLAWLTVDALCGQVGRAINRIRGPQQVAQLLGSGHLLLAPARRRAIRAVVRPERCLPNLTTATSLGAPAQVNLVRLIGSLGVAASMRSRRLADLIALPCPLARQMAVIALLGHDSADAHRALDQFCFDRAEPVAYLASQSVFARAGGPGEAMLERLERSGHRAIAPRATAALAGRSVEAFLQRWLRLSRNDQLAAALALAETHQRAMVDAFVAVLRRGQREEKLAAIMLSRRLGLVARLEDELIVQAADLDSHVASAAVAALADGGSIRRLDTVRLALRHRYARVRANAVEALIRIEQPATDLIDAMTSCRENRPRANAVWGLLRAQPQAGARKLRAMLTDPDPLHRVSAVWVASRARATPVLNDLRRLAEQDRISEVRTRAAAAARLLAHHAPAAWETA